MPEMLDKEGEMSQINLTKKQMYYVCQLTSMVALMGAEGNPISYMKKQIHPKYRKDYDYLESIFDDCEIFNLPPTIWEQSSYNVSK